MCMHGYCTVLAVYVVDVLCLQNLFTFKCMLWHMSGDGSLGVTLLFLTGSFYYLVATTGIQNVSTHCSQVPYPF